MEVGKDKGSDGNRKGGGGLGWRYSGMEVAMEVEKEVGRDGGRDRWN